MASNILSVFSTVYNALLALTPETYNYFPYRRHEGDTPLEEAVGKDLVRAFRVGLGRQTTPLTNSNRDTKWFRAPLVITLGYPQHLIDAADADRLGVEGMIATDTIQIVNAIYHKRTVTFASLTNTRLLAPWEAVRTAKTLAISFDLEWGEAVT